MCVCGRAFLSTLCDNRVMPQITIKTEDIMSLYVFTHDVLYMKTPGIISRHIHNDTNMMSSRQSWTYLRKYDTQKFIRYT